MLRIEKIQTFYGNIQALFDVSLEVREGEMVALIGGNGAGKSTTLKTISGLSAPSYGAIEFKGRKIHGLSPRAIVMMGISHCPEERRIWPKLTVWENLDMGAYTREDRKSIREDMERIFTLYPVLQERRNQLAGTLSGGEQQMLAIGRAIMSRPRLLLLDEPSLGLAPIMVEKTAEIIRGIHRNGTTVLLVEQNAFLALNLCDRAYLLETGKTVLEGKGKELLQNKHVQKAYLGMG
jgi:branched-chain amino acid transport system ATP-binding protein